MRPDLWPQTPPPYAPAWLRWHWVCAAADHEQREEMLRAGEGWTLPADSPKWTYPMALLAYQHVQEAHALACDEEVGDRYEGYERFVGGYMRATKQAFLDAMDRIERARGYCLYCHEKHEPGPCRCGVCGMHHQGGC